MRDPKPNAVARERGGSKSNQEEYNQDLIIICFVFVEPKAVIIKLILLSHSASVNAKEMVIIIWAVSLCSVVYHE